MMTIQHRPQPCLLSQVQLSVEIPPQLCHLSIFWINNITARFVYINQPYNAMSFQAYLKTIKEKTGLGPLDFKKIADEKGFSENGQLKTNIKATEIVNWLKQDFELGHGHAMAIYALLKGIKDENSA